MWGGRVIRDTCRCSRCLGPAPILMVWGLCFNNSQKLGVIFSNLLTPEQITMQIPNRNWSSSRASERQADTRETRAKGSSAGEKSVKKVIWQRPLNFLWNSSFGGDVLWGMIRRNDVTYMGGKHWYKAASNRKCILKISNRPHAL